MFKPIPHRSTGESRNRTGSPEQRSRLAPAAGVALLLIATATGVAQEDAGAWFELAVERSAAEDWNGAIEAYGKVIAIEPSNARARHNLGNARFRKGDFAAAAEAYRRALELDSEYALAAFHLGWTLRQLNRADEAEAAFGRCLELTGERPEAAGTRMDCLFGLGSLRQRAGDYTASAEMMEQVLAVHPAHIEARYYLAMAYRKLGRLEEARQQLAIHGKMLTARREALGPGDGPHEP